MTHCIRNHLVRVKSLYRWIISQGGGLDYWWLPYFDHLCNLHDYLGLWRLALGKFLIHCTFSLFWRVTTKLRYYPKDYVQELMAEAVSFLLRNAKTSSEQLKKGIFLLHFDYPAPWKHIFLWSLKLLTLHCFNCDSKSCVCALFCTYFWAAI